MLGGGPRYVKRHPALDMVAGDTYGARYFLAEGPSHDPSRLRVSRSDVDRRGEHAPVAARRGCQDSFRRPEPHSVDEAAPGHPESPRRHQWDWGPVRDPRSRWRSPDRRADARIGPRGVGADPESVPPDPRPRPRGRGARGADGRPT